MMHLIVNVFVILTHSIYFFPSYDASDLFFPPGNYQSPCSLPVCPQAGLPGGTVHPQGPTHGSVWPPLLPISQSQRLAGCEPANQSRRITWSLPALVLDTQPSPGQETNSGIYFLSNHMCSYPFYMLVVNKFYNPCFYDEIVVLFCYVTFDDVFGAEHKRCWT